MNNCPPAIEEWPDSWPLDAITIIEEIQEKLEEIHEKIASMDCRCLFDGDCCQRCEVLTAIEYESPVRRWFRECGE